MTDWGKIFAGIAVGFVAAVLSIGVWVGSIDTRVSATEEWIKSNRQIVERLAVVEAQTSDIRAILRRMEERLFGGGPAR